MIEGGVFLKNTSGNKDLSRSAGKRRQRYGCPSRYDEGALAVGELARRRIKTAEITAAADSTDETQSVSIRKAMIGHSAHQNEANDQIKSEPLQRKRTTIFKRSSL